MKYTFQLAVSYAEERPLTAPLPLCGELGEAMDYAKSVGFDGIEIHGREYEFEGEHLQKIRELREKTGVQIAALVSGRLYSQTQISLAEPETVKRAWLIAQMKKYIDAAATLKTGVIIGWIRGLFSKGNPKDLYFQILRQSLRELDAYAGEQNVPLLIEVINRYEVDCFKRADETLEFLEKNGLRHSYLHLDTFHMNIEEDDLCGAIRLAGKRLGYFHVADNTRRYPGSGILDFSKILETLGEINYGGFVTVECLPDPDGRKAAKRAAGYLRGLMQ